MNRPVVFAGPSIHGIEPSLLAGVDLRPPAGRGDLLAAFADGTHLIGLIDGTFENGASTWHKEILFALKQGATILGAASMGALRAAECAAFGMIGVGRVFQDYADGRRTSDADVAIVHAPAAIAYRPLTEALVDIEATLEHLVTQGLLGPEDAATLRATARKLHFKDRTWPRIVAQAGLADAALLQRHRLSVKTMDALALIALIRTQPVSSPFADAFSHTQFFDALLRERCPAGVQS